MTRRNGFARGLEPDLDGHALVAVLAVAVLDGVDHRFANRHADPVGRLVVEAAHLSDVIRQHLDHVQHVEMAGEIETDEIPGGRHALDERLTIPGAGAAGQARTVRYSGRA